MYIGRRPKKRPLYVSCLLTLVILLAGAYLSFLILAWRGYYIAPVAVLPPELRPTPTVTATPTEPAVNHLERADAYFRNGELDDAIAEYEQAVALEPNNATAFAHYARPLVLRYRKEDSLDVARRGVELSPTSENLAILALALDWAGIYDEALAYGLRAVQADYKNVLAHAYVAEIYADLNRLDRALESANTAIGLNKDSPEAQRNLGYVYEAYGNYGKALTQYRQAIQIAPNFSYLYVNVARIQRTQGQYRAAITTLEQAVKIDSNAPDVYDELGWAYYFAGDYEAAISQFKLAIKSNGNYSPAYGHLGVTYFSKQNWEEAVANLERAIQLGSSRLEYFYELGLSYVNLDRCDQAQIWITKAMQVGPTDEAAQAANGYYLNHCLGVPYTPTPRFRPTPTLPRR